MANLKHRHPVDGRPRPPQKRQLWAGVIAAAVTMLAQLLLVPGCGHPASVAECEEIVERITRLELEERQIGKDAVAAEVAETKTAMRDRMAKDCVGRRVTDRAMRCVREAKSSKKVEECFD